jgi:hypothetical protein
VSCSPFRVPIARLAAARAGLGDIQEKSPVKKRGAKRQSGKRANQAERTRRPVKKSTHKR